MAFQIVIEVNGVQKMIGFFDKTLKKISSFKEPLQKSAEQMVSGVRRTFDAEGRGTGGKWHVLSPATIKTRLRLGFNSGPILFRTGELKNSTMILKVDDNEAVISNSARTRDNRFSLARIHDKGIATIPARLFMKIEPDDARFIYAIFMKWVEGLIK